MKKLKVRLVLFLIISCLIIIPFIGPNSTEVQFETVFTDQPFQKSSSSDGIPILTFNLKNVEIAKVYLEFNDLSDFERKRLFDRTSAKTKGEMVALAQCDNGNMYEYEDSLPTLRIYDYKTSGKIMLFIVDSEYQNCPGTIQLYPNSFFESMLDDLNLVVEKGRKFETFDYSEHPLFILLWPFIYIFVILHKAIMF